MSRYEKIIESLLLMAEKPARYTGGEYNTPDMDKPCKARVCMCFPDLYEVGMSNLGIRILYHMLNDYKDTVAERCFAPAEDFAELLRNNAVPLLSLETKTPLKEFDILGFSVQFEMLYTNVLYMLDLAGIPFMATDRAEGFPIIIGGGPCTVNPEPFAEFFDIIVVGEGEEPLLDLAKLYITHKEKGYNKALFLKEARGIQGVYCPALEETEFTGRFTTVKGRNIVSQAYVKDFEKLAFPTAVLLPNIEAIHDRAVLELFRGCPNGCRFCQAGFTYRPIRARSAEKVVELGEKTMRETGFDEMSLASLSSSDYPYIGEVVEQLSAMCAKKGVKLALPSLRMDSFKGTMAAQSRLGSLTFAPEAGSQRLRNVINKNVTDEDIETTMREAFLTGYSAVKLYFMIGLPGESDEDITGIRETVLRIKRIFNEVGKGRLLNISVSAAVFVPKPVTPFQWEAQIPPDEIARRQAMLRGMLRIKGVSFSWHDLESSVLEAVFARGDRRLSRVIERAYRLGCKFDSWNEKFRYDLWKQAFAEEGADTEVYTAAIAPDEKLPWDYINFYVSKEYLLRERESALNSECTPSCVKGCRGCSESKLTGCGL